jgi:hypothetical protein
MRSVKVALIGAIVLLAAAVGVVLSRAPLTVASTNFVPAEAPIAYTRGNATSCQTTSVPQGTSAIRVALSGDAGPRLRITVLEGSRVVTQGERSAGWGVLANVVVPMRELSHTIPVARICVAAGAAVDPIAMLGVPLSEHPPKKLGLQDVRLSLEYLRHGSSSWWSLVPSIFDHMALGHAASGRLLPFLVLVMMLAIGVLALRLAAAELR